MDQVPITPTEIVRPQPPKRRPRPPKPPTPQGILNLVVRMTDIGREHRRAAGKVSDLKVGTIMDTIQKLKDLATLAIRLSTSRLSKDKHKPDAEIRAYLDLATKCHHEVISAAKSLPDIDSSPPLDNRKSGKTEKEVGPPKPFRVAARPQEQNLVTIKFKDEQYQNGTRPAQTPVVLPANGRPPAGGQRQDTPLADDW